MGHSYVGIESIDALFDADRPDVSWLGIALSASSVIVIAIAKRHRADQLGSAATQR